MLISVAETPRSAHESRVDNRPPAHSAASMTQGAWIDGSQDADLAAIRTAMEPRQNRLSRGMGRELYGGKGGTRTLDLGIMSATL